MILRFWQRSAELVRRIGVFGLISFITGFALMAYELVASRLLAPAIGSSTYVWTSVIGVIIAALALGYAAGGWLADKRVARQDIAWLLLGAAVAALGTLLFYHDVLELVVTLVQDGRLRGLLASALLFLPASFMLGAVSPYLVRLGNQSLATTGRTSAWLSALNAVGGITGTLCVGFLLFGLVGARETLAIVIALLVVASWLVVPRHKLGMRLQLTALVVVLLAAGLAPLQFSVVAELDTPTAHYQVIDARHKNRDARVLVTGPYAQQSGIFLDNPTELVFGYTRQVAELIAKAPSRERILVLGGGAFTLPQHLAQAYPSAQIDAVEIDPQLASLARQYFAYRDPANVRLIFDDARTFLQANTTTYDIVVVDVYGDLSIPFSLATREYAATLRRAVKPGGVVLANVIGSTSPACQPLLGSLNGVYKTEFRNATAFPASGDHLEQLQNIVIAYSNANLDWLQPLGPAQLVLPVARPPTDNFAPLERLQQSCA